MVLPIPQNAREKEEDDPYDWKSSDDDVTQAPTAIPTFPAGFPPSADDSETMFPTDIFTESVPTESHFPWTRWPPEGGFMTSTVSSSPAALSENAPPTTLPTPILSQDPMPTSTNVDGYGGGDLDGLGRKQSSNHGVLKVAAGVVPVVILVVIGFIIFFCLRKRKRQRQQQASARARMQEMKMRAQPSVQPYMAPPPTQPQYTAPPSHPPPASPVAPQPVILGPIVPGSNGAYFTGIDTSDIVSMNNDRTGLGNPFADGDSLNEEPPPPYRPRSIAPLSRDTSLRAPPAASSRTNLIGGHHQLPRSPFADPQDDDAVSDMSGPTLRRNHDGTSVVSDLSYQEDPVVARPTV